MNKLLSKFHLSIILIIFIMCICLLGLGLKEDFYVPKEQKENFSIYSPEFNIDKQVLSIPEYLGWKSFWRKNYTKWNNNLNDLFKDKPFSLCPSTKLLYDGIHRSPPFK